MFFLSDLIVAKMWDILSLLSSCFQNESPICIFTKGFFVGARLRNHEGSAFFVDAWTTRIPAETHIPDLVRPRRTVESMLFSLGGGGTKRWMQRRDNGDQVDVAIVQPVEP